MVFLVLLLKIILKKLKLFVHFLNYKVSLLNLFNELLFFFLHFF